MLNVLQRSSGSSNFRRKCVVLYSGGERDQTYPLLDMMAELLGVVGRRKGLATEGQVESRRIVHSAFSLSAQRVENHGAASVEPGCPSARPV